MRRLAIALASSCLACSPSAGSNADAGAGAGVRLPVGNLLLYDNADFDSQMIFVDTHALARSEEWLKPREDPSVSADGTRLAYGALQDYVQWRVRLAKLGPLGAREDVWERGTGMQQPSPIVFSPDRRRLLARTADGWLWVDTDTGEATNLGSRSPHVLWSPDARSLVLRDEDRGALTIYRDGVRVRSLPVGPQVSTSFEGSYPMPSFSPSGEWLALAVYHLMAGSNVPLYLGVQLFHLPTGVLTEVALDHPQLRFKVGFGAQSGHRIGNLDFARPFEWTPDSTGLVLNPWQTVYVGVTNECVKEVPMPLRVLRVRESFEQGADVIDELPVDDGSFPQGECVSRTFLGMTPDGKSALYSLNRHIEMSDLDLTTIYPALHSEYRRTKLDGSGWDVMGAFDRKSNLESAPGGFARFNERGDLLFTGGGVLEASTGKVTLAACSHYSPDGLFCADTGNHSVTLTTVPDTGQKWEIPVNNDMAEEVFSWR